MRFCFVSLSLYFSTIIGNKTITNLVKQESGNQFASTWHKHNHLVSWFSKSDTFRRSCVPVEVQSAKSLEL